jgi:Ca2+/Na+ antiporter
MGERPSVEKQSRLSNNIQQLRDTPTNSRPSSPTKRKSKAPVRLNKRPKSLTYHCMRLILGFLALSVSCYVLSHSVSEVGDELGLSNSLVGITILSLATTLPEKFVAIISGSKGEGGIIIANTAGSNIFLLTLCAGVLFTCGDKADMAEGFQFAEIAVMWLSSAVLCACVFFGANRKIGAVIMGLYVAFLIAEFTVFSH